MATSFSSLPIVDLSPLNSSKKPSKEDYKNLANQLYSVFATTGFAYLINSPLSFGHDAVFGLAKEFFALPNDEKMKLAKKTFRKTNPNTYRGYFPTQPDLAADNLKEGFEMGPSIAGVETLISKSSKIGGFDLSEPNVWPPLAVFSSRSSLERLYRELQSLASTLLSLLAVSLGKETDFFEHYLTNSLSTLRLLHYPPVQSGSSTSSLEDAPLSEKLSCTPHTDSGILTLLHQDATGGLEVLDAEGRWVPAPYIPGSIIVNIGDLMAKVSGGRFVATMHRVRAPSPSPVAPGQALDGRFSVPFFFEPGEECLVRTVDDNGSDGVIYGVHVRAKMKAWVEFQDPDKD